MGSRARELHDDKGMENVRKHASNLINQRELAGVRMLKV